MTLLVAGHETTASQLAWAFECLAREPRVVERLRAEIDAGESDAYLTATIQETLRRRPVLPNAAPRLVKQPVEIGGWTYPRRRLPGRQRLPDPPRPGHLSDPYAFRPERFLGEPPGTYTWIPFGGGRRRCLGASFAMLEMKIVLRALLARTDVRPGIDGADPHAAAGYHPQPARGATAVLSARSPAAPDLDARVPAQRESRPNDQEAP